MPGTDTPAELEGGAPPWTASADGLQTMHRALTILELFTASREEWAAAEVSAELSLSLATTSRFMRGLEARGYLARHSARGYRLGFAAMTLGRNAMQSIPMRSFVRPTLGKLARVSGETSLALTLLDSSQSAEVVDRAEGSSDFRITVAIGQLLPLHAGIAKTFLAYLPESEWRAVAKANRRPDLLKQLAQIRADGWCESVEGIESGTWGVAAPVLSDNGVPLLVVGIIAPLARHSPKIRTVTVDRVRAAAKELSDQLTG